ncbi:MAG: carbohydrate binding domain-containing protein [Verrucomicrobia bacterium]|nr:carbohydrate binding domain-containing protein [Verrucomicrobiota bacterium]
MKCFALLVTSALLAAAENPVLTDNVARVVLRNDRLTLALGHAERGAIVSLVDNASGQEFAAAQKTSRLFTLAFSLKSDASGRRFYLSSGDVKEFSVEAKRGEATLNYNGLGEWPVQIACTASVKSGDSFVRWRLSVKIPDALMLEEVQFPFITLRAPLGDSMDGDAAVFGHTKGGVIRKPGAMKVGSRVYGRQPGSLAAQFGCYYDDRAGFYTAAYDSKGYPKDFEMRRTADGIEMGWNPHCFASRSYTMDFDVVMTTFAGTDKATPADWRDAADIYKEWALRQPWCATPFDKRRDIPAWMKSGPAMVRFGREWLAQPERIEKWLTDYWKKEFSEAPLVTAYWGWEKIWSWVTPDYFPVFPSDEQFTNLVARTRALGCHAFPWPSGYHWTLMYRKQDDGGFYWDDRKRFDEVARPHAVRQRDGTLYIRTPSWLAGGDTATLCPGDPWTIRWWNEDISAPLARRGCEMIQVDQVVGGGFPFCYSRDHAHPPGPGLWMTEVFTKQLRTMFAACRKIERDAVVCVEEPNERFNHLVGIQDYRDCETPHEPASVFNYLYHEFLPTFQSNPRAGDTAMAAYCFANGQIPHLVPSMRGGGPALVNGGFEETNSMRGFVAGWEHLRGYQGRVWNGKAWRDEAEKHGGTASLRLENAAASDVVQVSQNVTIGDGLVVGKKYRLSAWLKTGAMAQPSGVNFAVLKPGLAGAGAGGRLMFPAAGAGWTRATAEFTVPEGAAMFRIMIHIEGKAKAWVDDMALEEVLPDGTTRAAICSNTPPDHKLMKRWVELYHGEGRPFLQFGRMLHPPKLVAATITWRGSKPFAAVQHNAWRASDGSEAVIAVNATLKKQTATLHWKDRAHHLSLDAGDAVLIR